MSSLPRIVTTALALFAATPLFCATATTASSHESGDHHGWSDDDEGRGDLRERLMERLQDRPERRELIRDLLEERRGSMMDEDEDRGGMRHKLRGRIMEKLLGDDNLRDRLRERIAERRGDECYFITRSVRDEDGDFLVIVRRRICRD